MFTILLHMILNPWVLYAALGLIALAVVTYFTLGPVFLWKIVSDVRTWIAIGGVLAVLAFAHGEKKNADLKADLARIEQTQIATEGALKTATLRAEQKSVRAAQSQRHQEAIQQAAPGTEEDALLDAIAADRPEYHGVQAPHDGVDRAGLAVFDGLRKQPDVVVVP